MAPRAGATVDDHESSYNFEQWVNGDGGGDSESHDDDNSEVLVEDKEYMKAIANRVPTGPSDCNCGMCECGRAPWAPNPHERRSKGRAAPKLCKRPQGSFPVDRGLEASVGACSWPTRVTAMRWGNAREVPAGPESGTITDMCIMKKRLFC